MNTRLALLLLAVFAITACVTPDFKFGLDALVVNLETSVEGNRDVLLIKDKLTIPKSPMLTDRSVQLSFLLENRDDKKIAENVQIELFDAPLMRNKDFQLCNQASTQRFCKSENEIREESMNILPGEEKQVVYQLISPTQDQIGGITTMLKLNHLVRYTFEGATSFTFPVVNENEILARQRAGDKVAVDLRKHIGSGPIQVDIELPQDGKFVLGGQSAVFFFKVKNKGSGNLPFSRVDPKNLCLYFPKTLFNPDKDSTILRTPDGLCYDRNAAKVDCIAKITAGDLGNDVNEIAESLGNEFSGAAVGNPTQCSSPNECQKYSCSSGYEQVDAACSIIDSVCCKPVSSTNTGSSSCKQEGQQLFELFDNCCSGLVPDNNRICVREGSTAVSEPLFNCVLVENAPQDVACNTRSDDLDGMILCYNNRYIELFRDESRVSMRFSTLNTAEIGNDPFKSMRILAKIKYKYELRDFCELAIIPARE